MAITSINIDPDKLEQVKRLTGAKSNREAVEGALDAVINQARFDSARITDLMETVHAETLIELADR